MHEKFAIAIISCLETYGFGFLNVVSSCSPNSKLHRPNVVYIEHLYYTLENIAIRYVFASVASPA